MLVKCLAGSPPKEGLLREVGERAPLVARVPRGMQGGGAPLAPGRQRPEGPALGPREASFPASLAREGHTYQAQSHQDSCDPVALSCPKDDNFYRAYLA